MTSLVLVVCHLKLIDINIIAWLPPLILLLLKLGFLKIALFYHLAVIETFSVIGHLLLL